MKQCAIAVSRFFNDNHLYSIQDVKIIAGLYLQLLQIMKICLYFLSLSAKSSSKISEDLKEGMQFSWLPTKDSTISSNKHMCSYVTDKNPGITSQLNDWGRTPLHYAALQGHLGVCNFIIKNSGDKNLAANSPHLAHINFCKVYIIQVGSFWKINSCLVDLL